MIDNDPSRSFEFFYAPIEAGISARRNSYSLGTIIAIYLLCAIIGVILLGFINKVIPAELSQFSTPENASGLEIQIYAQMRIVLDYLNANPLISAIFNTISGLAFLLITNFIGRKMNPSIEVFDSLSAITRFEIVKTFGFALLQIIAILMWMISPAAGKAFGIVLAAAGFALLFIEIKFLQGVFNLGSFGKALGLMLLTFLALFGLMFITSLILLVGVL